MSLSLLATAEEVGDRPALLLPDGLLSYRALAVAVRRVASALVRRGLGDGQPLGLTAEPTREALLIALAAIELGAPLVLLHPRSTERERDLQLVAAGARELVPPAIVADARRPLASLPDAPPDDGRPLCVLFTSGSSGAPKGVELSRRAACAAAQSSAGRLGWRDDDRWLLTLPFAHVGGLSIVVRCLLARRAIVVSSLPRFEPEPFVRCLERTRATLVSLVPTQLHRLLRHAPLLDPPARLRALLVGGAPTPPHLLRAGLERGWPLLPTYGLTETFSQVATAAPGDPIEGGLRPLPGVEIESRHGRIAVRSPALLSRYLPVGAHPPAVDGAGWYLTSDLGHLDGDGRLVVLGRADDVIVSGGEKVHPLEVEGVLLEHPAVGGACVFGVPDLEWGARVVAVVESIGTPIARRDLERHLGARLAPFKRPRQIALLPSLPTTVAGKVDRLALRERAASLPWDWR